MQLNDQIHSAATFDTFMRQRDINSPQSRSYTTQDNQSEVLWRCDGWFGDAEMISAGTGSAHCAFFIFFYCFFWAAAFPLWPLDMPTITESLIRAAGSSWGNRTKTHKCDPITLFPEIIPTLRFSGTYSRPDSLSFLFFFSPPRADNTPDDNQPSWRPSYLFIIN